MKKTFKTVAALAVITTVAGIVISGCSADNSEEKKPAEQTVSQNDITPSTNPETGENVIVKASEVRITRADFAVLLENTLGDNYAESVDYDFSDVPKEHEAYQSISMAVNAGYLEVGDNASFNPDGEITYEQAITALTKVFDKYRQWYDTEDCVANAIEHSLTDGVNALIGEGLYPKQAETLISNFASSYAQSTSDDDGYFTSGSYAFYNYNSSAKEAEYVVYEEAAMDMEMSVHMADAFAKPYEEPFLPYEDFNTEEYVSTDENVFKSPVTSPLSTFSIDTDTASYSNLRRFILNGNDIPNGAVRIEELINYFDYTPAQIEEDKPFGVKYTVAKCPWNEDNNLVMLTVSGEELKEKKPSNIVFLIDVSGSMFDDNKLPLVKKALAMLLDELDENDTISIVTYASGTGVALEPTPASEKEKILGVINDLRAGGSTSGASGIKLAYEQAEKHKIDGNNRVILCTDGDFNVGISSTGDLEKLISEKRSNGIFLSVLGFGMGNYKDSRMETLADKGDGNYAYIDNLREAKKVLVDDMSKTLYTIAKDVKIQVEFNPEHVKQYRLVGYENRMLNNEDFADDTKDAGELGAGATVTVLYEIVPEDGEIESELKYQDVLTTGSDDLMTVKIRYKMPEGGESILSEYPVASTVVQETGDDFRFAAAVAELGMILNDSEYLGNATLDNVIELARSGLSEDRFGLRSEFVQLVDLLRYTD